MKVVLGLGNPGKKYERTRHNLGFLVLDQVAAAKGVVFRSKKYHSLVATRQSGGEEALLVKPQTYMNRSGEAVRSLFRYLTLSVKDLIVVYDDLDIPLGRIRIRSKGGGGGHRGMHSILDVLGREDFFRIRVGIGRPPPGVDPTDFVLEPFSPEETTRLDQVLSKAADAVECLLEEGSHRAMEKFNRAD